MKNILLIICLSLLFACNSETQKETENQNATEERKVENFVEYYPSGIKKVEGKKVNGERHGRWVYYYDNGFMWSEGEYYYGKREGYSVVYYKDGRKKMKGQYSEDEKVGVWHFWDEDGNLTKSLDVAELKKRKDSAEVLGK